ncbi:hypothetical protein HpCHC53_09750 [Helicobacter pylori]
MENKNTQANNTSSSLERNELHNTIWKVANELRGSVDGWDFKQYVLGILFYRYISENMTHYINKEEWKRDPSFDYANLSDEEAQGTRESLIEEKGFYIPPSALFCNVLKNAPDNKDLNVTLQNIFNEIEKSSLGFKSEENVKGYEFKKIYKEQELKDNLKEQLEKLNDYRFTPKEWEILYSQFIANKNDDYKAKTRKIQEDPIFNLTLENGKTKNIKIIDKKNIHKNALQVIHQYSAKGGKYENRYDVSILVNGLPLVHVELKRRGVAIREAFNQIKRYQRDSFSAEDGLFDFVQIFVISNGTSSKYYSNTTRIVQLEKNHKADTFEFTNYWADSKNNNIEDLMDFAQSFFAKHSLLNVLTRYCVFTSDEVLLVMRPYQIVAAERILEKIKAAQNSKTYGKNQSKGFIWHTTGSGKTLTSFKSAALAKELESVSKVLFVVDRKDLDYQTMKECYL